MKSINTAADIPAEEIWNYRIEGLPAPSIGKKMKNSALKKAVFIIVILAAVSLSLYFGIRSVSRDTFEYDALQEGGYELTHFSNTGSITALDISSCCEIVYSGEDAVITADESKPVEAIGKYAITCDEVIESIHIGASVKEINAESFYSCKALRQITVDESNPCYRDIDGVLYNKDCTKLICCPVKHSSLTAEAMGYTEIPAEEDEGYEEYAAKVLCFTVPATVTEIGALAFNYTDVTELYLPEGLIKIDTMAFFKANDLRQIYSYTGDTESSNVSLPSSLTYIGSDAFSYTKALEYIFIPSAVEVIGHHAFWDSGIEKVCAERDEVSFSQVETGTHWRPQPSSSLINKSVEIEYGSDRK